MFKIKNPNIIRIGSLVKLTNINNWVNRPLESSEYGLVIDKDFIYGDTEVNYNIKVLVGDVILLMRSIDIENIA